MRKFIFSTRIKEFLKNVYFNFFRSNLSNSHEIYKFSDEKLKFTHILEGINYLKIAGNHGKFLPQTFFEFGCHSGRTFISAINSADYLKAKGFSFFAFDSFQGLPKTDPINDGIFKEGSFKTNLNDFKKLIKRKTYHKLSDKNIVSGFYNQSLTEKLQRQLPRIGMVHIDVDLYSSTSIVLDFIKPLLVEGSLILFDDWYCFPPSEKMGEAKAFEEFLSNNKNIEVQEWKNYSTFGKSFFITKINS